MMTPEQPRNGGYRLPGAGFGARHEITDQITDDVDLIDVFLDDGFYVSPLRLNSNSLTVVELISMSWRC